MSYEAIGTATINSKIMAIKKYSNGKYVLEYNDKVIYSCEHLKEMEIYLIETKAEHSFFEN